MPSTTVVIVGAGHAGLAMSWHLGARGIDHVVLERGEVANSWRTERWDSLRLLTPNWQSRLPGRAHDGADPDGFRTMPEVIRLLEGYARTIAAPVHEGRRGHPVGFSSAHRLALTGLRGDQGARNVLTTCADQIRPVPVEDPGIHTDIDTREDAARL